MAPMNPMMGQMPIPATFSKYGFINGPEGDPMTEKPEDTKLHTYHAVSMINPVPTGMPATAERMAVKTGACFPKPVMYPIGPITWKVANQGVQGECDGPEENMKSTREMT